MWLLDFLYKWWMGFLILFLIWVILMVTLRPYLQNTFVPFLKKKYPKLDDKNIIEKLNFGDKMIFGTSTASWQVEKIDNPSNWSFWEKQKKPDGKPYVPLQAEGCAHFENFNEDVELMKKMNMKAYRFSLSWSDIEPEEGKFNPIAFEKYKQMISTLQSNNIEPLITLHHFEHPQWLEEKGGVLNPDFVSYFKRYTEKVLNELKNVNPVKYWFTINEPNIFSFLTYLFHQFPCPETSFFSLISLSKIEKIDKAIPLPVRILFLLNIFFHSIFSTIVGVILPEGKEVGSNFFILIYIILTVVHVIYTIAFFFYIFFFIFKLAVTIYTLVKDLQNSLNSLLTLMICHQEGYKIIHEYIPDAKVSFANHIQPFWPEHKYSLFETVLAYVFNLFNTFVLNCVQHGYFQIFFVKYVVQEKPLGLDYIGINHYNGQWITYSYKHWDIGFLRSMQPHIYEMSETNWCITYDSLAKTIQWINEKWNPRHLDIIISENGIADDTDKQRRKFLQLTLYYLKEYMEKYNLPVKMYLHWSLLDNYEWADGYTKHFGLIDIIPDEIGKRKRSRKPQDDNEEINDETTNVGHYTRIPRPSAEIYMKIAAMSKNASIEELTSNLVLLPDEEEEKEQKQESIYQSPKKILENFNQVVQDTKTKVDDVKEYAKFYYEKSVDKIKARIQKANVEKEHNE